MIYIRIAVAVAVIFGRFVKMTKPNGSVKNHHEGADKNLIQPVSLS